jgi:cellulose synthase/poly-beta-1,6-N-acetylglucosamine synthase-like glycosyltransferase
MWTLAQWLLWAGIATLFLTYIGYPMVLAAVARFLTRRGTIAPEDRHLPMTLVISLHNEKVVINDKLRNALGLTWRGGVTILLADDGSTDGSEDVCRQAAVDHPGRVVHVRIPRGGKNRALNAALQHVGDGIVVFTDANAIFEKEALNRIGDVFRDPRIGCAIGQLRFHKDGQSLEGAYWRYENLLKRLESALGSMVVGNGAIIAARRQLIPELLPGLANDLQIPLAVARQGYRSTFEPAAVAWEYLSDTSAEEFQRKVRMATRGLSHAWQMLSLAPGWLKLQYVFHKVLRWLTGVILVAVLGLSIALAAGRGGVHSGLLGLQLAFYAAAAAGAVGEKRGLRIPGMRFPHYFTMMHLAGLIAVGNVLRNRSFETWDKPASTRRSLEPGADPSESGASQEECPAPPTGE